MHGAEWLPRLDKVLRETRAFVGLYSKGFFSSKN